MQKIVAAVAIAALVVGCGYNNYDEPQQKWAGEVANTPLSMTREWADKGENVPAGVIFGGVVTANDRCGNLYQAIVVEDQSAAVEVKVGFYDLANLFPVGARVVIKAEGLAVAPHDGVMQMGRTVYDWSDYRMEPIGVRKEVDRRIKLTSPTLMEPQPVEVESVAELSEDMCGRLVRLARARFAGTEEKWGTNPYSSIAYRLFVTPQGDSLAVYTSTYADYADKKIPPQQEVSLCGTLYRTRLWGDERYVIKPRGYEDIGM